MFGLVPFRKANASNQELLKVLDSVFEEPFFSTFGLSGGFRVDVKDNANNYEVMAELPGMKKEEIGIDVKDDVLTISVCKNEEKNEETSNYIRRERKSGSYYRSFHLRGVQEDGIKATYQDGILRVTLPKDEKKNDSRKIEIQ